MSLIMSMDHDHHQEPGNAYHDPNGQWPDSSNVYHSQHQSPVHEYNGFAFTPMPMEPMYGTGSMPPPRTTHQALQPLIMPQWPSMLTSQSNYVPPLFPSAPLPAPPVSAPLSAPATTGRQSSSTPRKTLTDADRRRMCLYAEEHPTVKQTEIGAMFGVERSTVSKVLRNKEKYLYQDDGSRSPVRKAKGKFPDIERALSNWAKNHQKQGLPLTDALIKEKFRFFATTVGSSESLPKANNNSWLEKFKQKNNLMGAKSRKSSIADETEGASNPGSGSHTPSNTSPTSPDQGKEGSPTAMSVTKSEDGPKLESPDTYVDFSGHGHKPYHSLSNASLASTFTDAAHSSSFSPGPQSPTSPFFATDTASPFIPPGQARAPTPSASNFSRPRSQTFPMLGVEPYVSPPSSEPLTPKYVSSTVLESPMTELSNPLATVEEGSISSMQPPPPPHGTMSEAIITTSGISAPMLQTQATPALSQSSPITPSSAISSMPPGSPTLEETRRALEVVMSYLQHQPSINVEPRELITMGGLMERLKLQGSRQGSVSAGVSTPDGIGVEMPGGMHRIPSGDFKNMLSRSE